jgi:VIT1/CCC1 family predicted Fe2+/Mn2+ transporter
VGGEEVKKTITTEFDHEISSVVEMEDGKIISASIFEFEHEETPEEAYERGLILQRAAIEAGYKVTR